MSGISTSRHHADWLSLVEVSGPFVSLPVLLKVFPQGLDSRDPAQAKALRAAYEEWQDNPAAPGRQHAWVLHVLTALLGYPTELIAENQTLPPGLEANMAEIGETLRPDFALVGNAGSETAGQAQLLIASYPAEQSLDRPVIGRHWKATPATRMTELLHASGVALGLVTNGEHWMLVFAPRGDTTGYASWYGTLWLDEPITLRAFHSLLGVRRFFGVTADTALLGLLKESAQDQQEVTDQLGYQVREAVEVLVQAFDTLDQDSHRTLLNGVSEAVLYEAALTVMMRLVFLFSAEERGLLHLGKPLYDDNYAVSTLLEQLQEVADLYGPQVLERWFDAWARLLATFRAVHAGVHHQDLLMPAYGGSLFDPDRYPFLEGRAMGTNWSTAHAEPLAVNNRVALHLLNSLQKLRIRIPGGGPSEARRVSFRALGVEQIGHVYEGLLDHTAVRATEPVVGVKGTRDKEAEIPLTTLEGKLLQGQDTVIDFLKDETGRSVSALKRAMDEGNLNGEYKLLIACGHDKELLRRIQPFAGLVREDSFERPVMVLPGSVYVTAGTARRSTGTHYTPPSLTGPIVQHTLEPLVYQGPAEGLPRGQWQLKSPKEILDLKVCDMAMGSGAFLVQACRYLAERLTEAWENEEKKHPGEMLATPEGGFSQGAPSERLVPQDAAERLAIARRVIADRCLYGVDINPMAVEMAKLSLWLMTLDAKRPFTFLDHAFKCGDSLLGLSNFKQLEDFTLRPVGGKQIAFSTMNLWRHVDEAKKKREALELMPSDVPEQIAAKVALYAEAEEAVAKLRAVADVLVAVELKGLRGRAYETERETAADHMLAYWVQGLEALRGYAEEQLGRRRTLHWLLSFPEIMERGGFDAFVGNPPFLGGKRISSTYGEEYAEALAITFPPTTRNVDLCGYFHMRCCHLLKYGGVYGLISTERVLIGDTKTSCLDVLSTNFGSFYRIVESMPWPGAANVSIAVLNFIKRTSEAVAQGQESAQCYELIENESRSFVGCAIQGMGFVLEADEPSIAAQKGEAEVVRPFLIADDLNSSIDSIPSRSIIFFAGKELSEADAFPYCLNIVKTRVKPYRDTVNRKAHRDRWWQYGDRRPGLYSAISSLERALVVGLTSKHLAFEFVPSNYVYDQTTVVVATDSYADFSILSSSIHQQWALKFGANLGGTPRYNPSRCFVTFPFPNVKSNCAIPGKLFHSFRQVVIRSRSEGLTKIYNRFHLPQESQTDIVELRRLQGELDREVSTAYGWKDLDLGHGFHETQQGLRYTISEAARGEVLDRLLALNHQRHAEEEAEKIKVNAKPKPAIKRSRKPRNDGTNAVNDLFDLGEAKHEER